MPFSWIFSIIAGSIILILAVYATTQLINTSEKIKNSEAGVQLTTILNPVVNGLSSAYSQKPISLTKETRISVDCNANYYNSYFGKQSIGFFEQSGFLKKWNVAGLNISLYNKYVFSDSLEEGKTLYLFSKPFYSGFRVDDLVFMDMNKYCFVSAPENIEKEITDLSIANINISSDVNKCSKTSISVCFDFTNDKCNVSVYGNCNGLNCASEYDTGYVVKGGKQVNYFGSLMYGAIFSSNKIYECNVQRLGKKISALAKVYEDKADLVKARGCDSTVGINLPQISLLSQNLTSSKLLPLYNEAEDMDKENRDSNCPIYNSQALSGI
jgi:hypothetical protein